MYKILLIALTNNWMLQQPYATQLDTHSKDILYFAHSANTHSTIKSTTILYFQIHKIAHSNYIGFVLLASMYSNQRPEKNRHWLHEALKQIEVKARIFYVNIEQRMTNEQREGKKCKMRKWKVENMKTTKCKKIPEIDLKGSWSC